MRFLNQVVQDLLKIKLLLHRLILKPKKLTQKIQKIQILLYLKYQSHSVIKIIQPSQQKEI